MLYKITAFIFLLSVNQAMAQQDHCVHQGKEIKPYDSVWVLDSALVRQYTDELKSRGMPDKHIRTKIMRSDFLGFRLVCLPVIQYQRNKQAQRPTEEFIITGYALTLNLFSMNYFKNFANKKI